MLDIYFDDVKRCADNPGILFYDYNLFEEMLVIS